MSVRARLCVNGTEEEGAEPGAASGLHRTSLQMWEKSR